MESEIHYGCYVCICGYAPGLPVRVATKPLIIRLTLRLRIILPHSTTLAPIPPAGASRAQPICAGSAFPTKHGRDLLLFSQPRASVGESNIGLTRFPLESVPCFNSCINRTHKTFIKLTLRLSSVILLTFTASVVGVFVIFEFDPFLNKLEQYSYLNEYIVLIRLLTAPIKRLCKWQCCIYTFLFC